MDRTEKTYKVIWSYHSQLALQDVYEYISIDSEHHAYRVINEIQDLGNSLIINPYKFQECVELPTKNHVYRKATYARNYKIIYKIVRLQIWILDVFHGKRNPASLRKLRRIKP
jgi:plasmid stabilization system protein ParE